jgi:cyclophilin family peptidyl-prolyl cis-trans isomerase
MKRASLVLLFTLVLSAGGCPSGSALVEGNPRVRFNTTFGSFVIELDPVSAPLTVENFITYVNDGFYEGTVFHRVIPGFVIQGGGYTTDLALKETRAPVRSESRNGLRNERGAVGIARTDDPDSATSQFYVNLLNNFSLDATLTSDGYTVFGWVVEGMDVLDSIALVETSAQGELTDVPVENIVVESVVFEPAASVVSPEYQAYIDNIGISVLSAGRDALVAILEGLITGG